MEKRILVVDDDDDIRESIVGILALRGFRAEGAAHGKAALEKLRRDEPLPSLIVTDLAMPVMDGWRLIEEMKSDPRLASIPCVVFSASLRIGEVASLGAVTCVAKSENLLELLRVIESDASATLTALNTRA
jgi:CheY-like chemotaxis protein